MTEERKPVPEPATPDNSEMIRRSHESVARTQTTIEKTAQVIEATELKLSKMAERSSHAAPKT